MENSICLCQKILGLPSPDPWPYEHALILTSRPPTGSIPHRISSRIHFWDLEGPKMTKLVLKLRFSIKHRFSWRSAPIHIPRPNHRIRPWPGPEAWPLARPELAWGEDRHGQSVGIWNIWFPLVSQNHKIYERLFIGFPKRALHPAKPPHPLL